MPHQVSHGRQVHAVAHEVRAEAVPEDVDRVLPEFVAQLPVLLLSLIKLVVKFIFPLG